MPTPAQAADNDWMADLMVDAPASPSAPAAPAQTPTPHTPPASRLDPADIRTIVEGVRSQTAAVAPQVPAAPASATTPEPVSVFGEGLTDLTPEEQERLSRSGAADLLQKVALRAVHQYDREVGAANRREIATLREQQAQAQRAITEENARTQTSITQARFPQLAKMRQDPNWPAFISQEIMTPAGAMPIQAALGMASDSGNYAFIEQTLANFVPANAAPAESTPDMSSSFSSMLQGGARPQTAAVQPRVNSGGSAPSPSLAQVSQGTQVMSRSKAEQKLQELARAVDLNPANRQALEKYDALSHAMRTAHLEGRLV